MMVYDGKCNRHSAIPFRTDQPFCVVTLSQVADVITVLFVPHHEECDVCGICRLCVWSHLDEPRNKKPQWRSKTDDQDVQSNGLHLACMWFACNDYEHDFFKRRSRRCRSRTRAITIHKGCCCCLFRLEGFQFSKPSP